MLDVDSVVNGYDLLVGGVVTRKNDVLWHLVVMTGYLLEIVHRKEEDYDGVNRK